jgi:hypothetical protein
MRRPFVYLGALALGSGAAMILLLGQLRSDFFRAYLPPWAYVSYGTIAFGVILVIVGVRSKPGGPDLLRVAKAGSFMAKLALANAVGAACLVSPVLVPSFRLPILLTQWPGIYMTLAYFSFLVVGVLGMAGWSSMFVHLPETFGKDAVGGVGFAAQVILTEVGVYALAISMFLGGYVGSWLSYTGAGPVAVGAQMEFSVIPSAVSIYLVVAGTIVGVANVLMSGRSVSA